MVKNINAGWAYDLRFDPIAAVNALTASKAVNAPHHATDTTFALGRTTLPRAREKKAESIGAVTEPFNVTVAPVPTESLPSSAKIQRAANRNCGGIGAIAGHQQG